MAPDQKHSHESMPNPGYVAWQLSKALTTSADHDDPATRERARIKVEKWLQVLEGLFSGRVAVGSRQPLADVPVWATTEVLTGGFVTGRLLAGGPFLPHEIELTERLGVDVSDGNREKLNVWFLSETGLGELAEMLDSGCYEIELPEEAALPVAIWLARNDAVEEARELIESIAPYFQKLRFYPKPAGHPIPLGPRIFLESVGTVIDRLKRIQPNPKILAQHESIRIWKPHYENVVSLFLETVAGEIPTIQKDAEGRWVSPETRRFHVVGGWPCQNYAADWCERAQAAVTGIERDRATHKLCHRPDDAGDSFMRLFGYLRKCSEAPASLSGRDVGTIRLIIARHVTRHGRPGSPQHVAETARQWSQTAKPTHDRIARLVIHRLTSFSAHDGLDDLAEVLQPVIASEASKTGITTGTEIPPTLVRKVERSLCDTAEVLVERGIITSGETLARAIPKFTASLRASALDHTELRALYAATYRAFRRRRSLLLLDLEKQVQLEELPWVAAIERRRRKDLSGRELALLALQDVAALVLRAFPHVIIPNKLLQEFRALAKAGELDLPFVEELAADIFMDAFSPKFTHAARQAAAYVEGTLYARYFDIECAAIRRLSDNNTGPRHSTWFRRDPTRCPFAMLCIERAGVEPGKQWDVARNGMVIEQAQILTTHNLALLFGQLGLEPRMKPYLRDMAERCFRWICRRQQTKTTTWHAKLIMLKQSAFAWRQMVFYVSRLSPAELGEFIAWAGATLQEQSDDFRTRFLPALRGLALARDGVSPVGSPDARRFLGWTQKQHWLLGEQS